MKGCWDHMAPSLRLTVIALAACFVRMATCNSAPSSHVQRNSFIEHMQPEVKFWIVRNINPDLEAVLGKSHAHRRSNMMKARDLNHANVRKDDASASAKAGRFQRFINYAKTQEELRHKTFVQPGSTAFSLEHGSGTGPQSQPLVSTDESRGNKDSSHLGVFGNFKESRRTGNSRSLNFLTHGALAKNLNYEAKEGNSSSVVSSTGALVSGWLTWRRDSKSRAWNFVKARQEGQVLSKKDGGKKERWLIMRNVTEVRGDDKGSGIHAMNGVITRNKPTPSNQTGAGRSESDRGQEDVEKTNMTRLYQVGQGRKFAKEIQIELQSQNKGLEKYVELEGGEESLVGSSSNKRAVGGAMEKIGKKQECVAGRKSNQTHLENHKVGSESDSGSGAELPFKVIDEKVANESASTKERKSLMLIVSFSGEKEPAIEATSLKSTWQDTAERNEEMTLIDSPNMAVNEIQTHPKPRRNLSMQDGKAERVVFKEVKIFQYKKIGTIGPDTREPKSILGPGPSVAVTAAGIGIAMYVLARTYRYLVPLGNVSFPFVDYKNPGNTTNNGSGSTTTTTTTTTTGTGGGTTTTTNSTTVSQNGTVIYSVDYCNGTVVNTTDYGNGTVVSVTDNNATSNCTLGDVGASGGNTTTTTTTVNMGNGTSTSINDGGATMVSGNSTGMGDGGGANSTTGAPSNQTSGGEGSFGSSSTNPVGDGNSALEKTLAEGLLKVSIENSPTQEHSFTSSSKYDNSTLDTVISGKIHTPPPPYVSMSWTDHVASISPKSGDSSHTSSNLSESSTDAVAGDLTPAKRPLMETKLGSQEPAIKDNEEFLATTKSDAFKVAESEEKQ